VGRTTIVTVVTRPQVENTHAAGVDTDTGERGGGGGQPAGSPSGDADWGILSGLNCMQVRWLFSAPMHASESVTRPLLAAYNTAVAGLLPRRAGRQLAKQNMFSVLWAQNICSSPHGSLGDSREGQRSLSCDKDAYNR